MPEQMGMDALLEADPLARPATEVADGSLVHGLIGKLMGRKWPLPGLYWRQ